MKPYNPAELEPKWQNYWLEKKLFEASAESNKKKFYTLVEFPYPSGDGLHVGHVRSYTALDIIARKRRAEGFNVLYPMGWDAFGLPTENYAIKTGIKPTIVTKQNSDTFRRQLQAGGFSFDWSREINTTDPKYYKWTQWIFLQLYKHGLAYKAKQAINWCPKDKIGLANEEVIDGKCERCGTPVEQREKEQWLLAITKYADRLDKDLDTVDYLERIKIQQRNWIGKSEGAIIKFDEVEVFTTRPETIFGATFIAVAGKVDRDTGKKVTNPATGEQIPVWEAEYVMDGVGTGAVMGVPAHDERDYAFATKHNLLIKEVIVPNIVDKRNPPRPGKKTVERNNIHAIVRDPKTGKYLALKWDKFDWLTFPMGGREDGEDSIEAARREVREETGFVNLQLVKVLEGQVRAEYFAAHKDENRVAYTTAVIFDLLDYTQEKVSDSEQAQHEIIWLDQARLNGRDMTHVEVDLWNEKIASSKTYYTGHGVLINSGDLSGKKSEEVKDQVIKLVNGKPVTTYKLRDWVFSRQRYWGEPIPMIDCPKCGWQPVPEEQLPVTLPDVERYEPTDTGESPLATIADWVNTTCPKCGGAAKRETDTMPNWAGSSWYYLAYPSKDVNAGTYDLHNKKILEHWTPVDWYNGGMEHTTLHLLYSRFWHKFLFDIGVVPTSEPYAKRTSHGIILAGDGEKMSKSRGNVINPDEIIKLYGADTLRIYEMFMGPFEQMVAWNTDSIIGSRRFLERVWLLGEKVGEVADDNEIKVLLNNTVQKVSSDIEAMKFNTAISSLMVLVNKLSEAEKISAQIFATLLQLVAPFAPHMAEELWREALGQKDSIQMSAWPVFDPALVGASNITLIIQVNGVVRDKVELGTSVMPSEAELQKLVLERANVKKWLAGKDPSKFLVVQNKLVNIVV